MADEGCKNPFSQPPQNQTESTLPNWVLHEITDHLHINVCITDLHTDQILFMNDAMKQSFNIEHPEGKICWQVLQTGQEHRCAFCPIRFLEMSSSENACRSWTEKSGRNGRIYENYDGLMSWTDGKMVHFQYSVDVTDTNRLAVAANLAKLTGSLNPPLHRKQTTPALTQGFATALVPGDFRYDKGLLYDALVHSTDDYLYVCNMKTGAFRFPQTMVEEFGLPSQVITDATRVWGQKIHEHDRPAFLEVCQDLFEGRTDRHNMEYRAQNRKGEWVWLRCKGQVERDKQGTPVLFAGIITNLGKKNKIDHLTGLFHKFEFEGELQQLLAAKIPLVLMTLGIDDLKRINNLYDRAFGDEVIRLLSQKIQSLLPPTATMFRLDGDEFGIIFPHSEPQAATALFTAIQQICSKQQCYDGKHFFCTLSAGCTMAPQDHTDYFTLLKYAAYALDYAKSHGKNRLEFFTPTILNHMERTLALTELLRESIENDFCGFEVYYQPVCTTDRTIQGAEALARWHCPEFGHVPPLEFIPLLEEQGLILRAGRWIFAEAVKKCAAGLAAVPNMIISINLSCLQLEDPELIPFLQTTLAENGVSGNHIILELTESYLAANLAQLTTLLQQIRGLGIQIAMDDFGTGYSSLSVLKQAPIDIVKIDRTFINGILSSKFDYAFIRFVVTLCHLVGIKVCVEGVETEAEYEAAKTLEVNYLQGFLLGRPQPWETFQNSCLSHI